MRSHGREMSHASNEPSVAFNPAPRAGAAIPERQDVTRLPLDMSMPAASPVAGGPAALKAGRPVGDVRPGLAFRQGRVLAKPALPEGPAATTAGPDPFLRSGGGTAMASAMTLAQTEPNAAERSLDPIVTAQAEAPGQARQGAPAPAAPSPFAAAQGAPPQVSQISAAIRGSTDPTFDIHLSPAELGKVRITLTPSDTGIIVSVLADRPETLDLLRRHADLLAQDFREMGYESAAFSFGAGGQSDAGGRQGTDKPVPQGAQEEAAPVDRDAAAEHPAGPLMAAGRVDLRL